MAKDTRWDRNLSVAPDADGLIGHAGAVLLRKLADQCGLTSALGAALGRKGKFPLIDRGMALVSMAVAIALGATSMSDIAVLAHQEPVLGAAPSDTTVRRTLELADPRDPGQDRPGAGGGPGARVAADLREAGRVPVAGHRREAAGGLAGHRHGRDADHRAQRQGGSRPTWKKGYGFHPLGAWAGEYARVPGDAAAARQRRARTRSPITRRCWPRPSGRSRPGSGRKLLVRVDGAGRQPRAHQAPAVDVLAAADLCCSPAGG